jgi:RND family efflux transporter MFP subunit
MSDVKTIKKLTLVCLGLVAVGCHATAAVPQSPQAVQTQRVGLEPAAGAAGMRYSAIVEADADVPLSFRIPGYVVGLMQVRGENGRMRDLAEGDSVTSGSVLVRIRSTEYQDKVRQAQSHAEAAEALAQRAQLDFDRATRLYAAQSLTKPDFDAARAQYDSTQGELRAARAVTSESETALSDTAVVAPFNGEVVSKSVELGAFVGPGAPVFAVAKTDVVKIVIGVPDTAVRYIKLGQVVDVTVDAMADRSFQARVSRISSAADAKTRNFEVEVAIPNRDHVLKAGMIGALQFAVPAGHRQQPVVQIPLSAVVQASDGKYGVFVLGATNEGNVATLRQIEIGPIVGTNVTVAGGLSPDDEVITMGANLVKDGQRVEVVR